MFPSVCVEDSNFYILCTLNTSLLQPAIYATTHSVLRFAMLLLFLVVERLFQLEKFSRKTVLRQWRKRIVRKRPGPCLESNS